MKPVDVKPSIYIITLIKKIIKKALNLKLVCHYKIVITKVKILFRRHMLLVILKMKILLERFTKKNSKKQIKKSL